MWIKLHLYQSGDEVAVQTQNICAVYPDQRDGWGEKVTCIQFNGEVQNFMRVRESVDEIGEKITE